MVRLKANNKIQVLIDPTSLNSTMVRLKAVDAAKERGVAAESQFHYGSIKSYHDGSAGRTANTSQFHYGSIKRTDKHLYKLGSGTSQFHYGSIKSEIKRLQVEIIAEVSIPLWFD